MPQAKGTPFGVLFVIFIITREENTICYLLFGNINEDAFNETFLEISQKNGFLSEPPLKRKDFPFQTDIGNGVFFYVTHGYCDCNSAIGSFDCKQEELVQYMNWLRELKKCKKLKAIHIMKCWIGSNKAKALNPIISTYVDNVNAEYLANMNPDGFYRIEYFKRYG